jgi:hypothetical protein
LKIIAGETRARLKTIIENFLRLVIPVIVGSSPISHPSDEQAKLLRLLKCDEIQGFLFSPGVPAEQIEEFLRNKKTLE